MRGRYAIVPAVSLEVIAMNARFTATLAAALLVNVPTLAQATILNEMFDSYANQDAFDAVWVRTPPDISSYGILVPNVDAGLTPPNDNPSGLQGKAVNILSRINVYNGPATAALANLLPTATQSIRLSADIFDDGSGGPRATVGLRNSAGANIIELGHWNANVFDPYDPVNAPPAEPQYTEAQKNYAVRIAVFPAPTPTAGGLVRNPDWQYFQLDPVLDRPHDFDEIVTRADIGSGWHRWTAIISLTSVTFEFDLFRDGRHNTGHAGVGPIGLDATVTYEIAPSLTAPFNNLRIGSPSGVINSKDVVVDNILLELIHVADFNHNGVVDAADYTVWRDGLEGPNFEKSDYSLWRRNFGATGGSGDLAVVPEPCAWMLALFAFVAPLTTFLSRQAQPDLRLFAFVAGALLNKRSISA
ncbi:MAG: hypothetical protein WD851_01480 [Pirellulales bacterium]